MRRYLVLVVMACILQVAQAGTENRSPDGMLAAVESKKPGVLSDTAGIPPVLAKQRTFAADGSDKLICSYPENWFPDDKSWPYRQAEFRSSLQRIAQRCASENGSDSPAYDGAAFTSFLQGAGQWSGAEASWAGVQATWAGVLISLAGFIFIGYQLKRERQALQTQTGWTMYEASLSVLDMFVKDPALRPYFYDKAQLPVDDLERSRVLAAAEVICDHLENITNSGNSGSINPESFYVWVRYMYMLGLRSSVVLDFLSDQPHPAIDIAKTNLGEGRRYDKVFKEIVLLGKVPAKCSACFKADPDKLPGLFVESAA